MEGNQPTKFDERIITADDIFKILKEYHIGKKPLAKLLGWGETTIIRYIDGDIPTSEYSNKLWALLDNPNYYLTILTQNQDKLTGVAYRKSRNAVLAKIMESKTILVAQYMINATKEETTPMSVQAMLYYAQGFSLVYHNVELFEDDYMVNSENIPYPKVYKKMKAKSLGQLDIGEDILSEREKKLIDAVIEVCGWYGPKALSAIIAYEKISLKISRNEWNQTVVSKETLKAYFKELIQQYNLNSIQDISRYADQRMSQIKALLR